MRAIDRRKQQLYGHSFLRIIDLSNLTMTWKQEIFKAFELLGLEAHNWYKNLKVTWCLLFLNVGFCEISQDTNKLTETSLIFTQQ